MIFLSNKQGVVTFNHILGVLHFTKSTYILCDITLLGEVGDYKHINVNSTAAWAVV